MQPGFCLSRKRAQASNEVFRRYEARILQLYVELHGELAGRGGLDAGCLTHSLGGYQYPKECEAQNGMRPPTGDCVINDTSMIGSIAGTRLLDARRVGRVGVENCD